MGSHTPGPWERWGDGIYSGIQKRGPGFIKGKRMVQVCRLEDDREDLELHELAIDADVSELDANLICAAPELLALARRMVALLALGDNDAYGLTPDTADALNGLRCGAMTLIERIEARNG